MLKIRTSTYINTHHSNSLQSFREQVAMHHAKRGGGNTEQTKDILRIQQ